MSRESVDVQINAKDQSEVQTSNEEVKPWYVNYQPKTPNLVTVGGYVEAKKQKDGTYQAKLHIDVGDQKRSTVISNESAVAIAKAAGTQGIKTTDGGMIVPLNSNAVAEIAEREFNLDLKAVNIDKNSHKGDAVNKEADKSYTVNALAAPTITDWETNDPTKRKEVKIVTGTKADVKVKANDTGKGGTGTAADKGASADGTGEGANSTTGGSGLGDGTGGLWPEGVHRGS